MHIKVRLDACAFIRVAEEVKKADGTRVGKNEAQLDSSYTAGSNAKKLNVNLL